MKTTELIKAEEFIKNNYTLINGNEDYMCNETYKIVGVHEIAEKYAQQRVNEVLDKAANNFEKEIAAKSDYFNHRVGMFNAVKESILKLKNNEK